MGNLQDICMILNATYTIPERYLLHKWLFSIDNINESRQIMGGYG